MPDNTDLYMSALHEPAHLVFCIGDRVMIDYKYGYIIDIKDGHTYKRIIGRGKLTRFYLVQFDSEDGPYEEPYSCWYEVKELRHV